MKWFDFDEFERSETAAKRGIVNRMGEKERANVKRLVDDVLDPLREAWGRPLRVTSGYRCAELNRAVGGAAGSHHLRGMAADVTTGNVVDNRRLFQLVLDMGLPFTQLMDEKGFSWVHIGYDPQDVRRQVLKL